MHNFLPIAIEVLAIHLRILGDSLLPSFAAYKRPPHGTCYDSTGRDDDRRREHNPTAPC